MVRKTGIIVLFCAILAFKIVISQSKLRKFESKLNLLQSKLTMLESKVFRDELEFRDDIETIFDQLNDTAKGGHDPTDKSSDLKQASTESRSEITETLNKMKAIQDGFESEKRYIRNQLKVFEAVLSDMQQQLKDATAELLENADKRLMDVENKIADGKSYTNMIREEMGLEIALIKQNISAELNVSSNSQKEMKVTVDNLKLKISENRELINGSQDKIGKIQTDIDNIKEAPFLECGSWIRFGMSCYKLFHNEVPWDDAVRLCTSEEAYLAEVDNSEENTFIVNLVNITETETDAEEDFYTYDYEDYYAYNDDYGSDVSPSNGPKTGPWIGASDKGSEGKWVWEYSRRHLIRTYDSWNDGEPNGGTSENCLHMYENLHYMWNDTPCDLKKPYVCEKSVNVKCN